MLISNSSGSCLMSARRALPWSNDAMLKQRRTLTLEDVSLNKSDVGRQKTEKG